MNATPLLSATSLNPSSQELFFTMNFFKRLISKNHINLQKETPIQQNFAYNYEKAYYITNSFKPGQANNQSIGQIEPFFDDMKNIPQYDVKKEIFEKRIQIVDILLIIGFFVFAAQELMLIFLLEMKEFLAICIAQFVMFIIFVLAMFYTKYILIKKKITLRLKLIKRKIKHWNKSLFDNFGQMMVPGEFGAWLELHVINKNFPNVPKNTNADKSQCMHDGMTCGALYVGVLMYWPHCAQQSNMQPAAK